MEFAALEQNAYSLLYSRLDRSAIRSISIYMEEATVNGAGIGYCSRVGAHKNHACPGLPDGVSSLELLCSVAAMLTVATSRGEERTRIDDERFQLTSNSLANFSLGGEEKHI